MAGTPSLRNAGGPVQTGNVFGVAPASRPAPAMVGQGLGVGAGGNASPPDFGQMQGGETAVTSVDTWGGINEAIPPEMLEAVQTPHCINMEGWSFPGGLRTRMGHAPMHAGRAWGTEGVSIADLGFQDSNGLRCMAINDWNGTVMAVSAVPQRLKYPPVLPPTFTPNATVGSGSGQITVDCPPQLSISGLEYIVVRTSADGPPQSPWEDDERRSLGAGDVAKWQEWEEHGAINVYVLIEPDVGVYEDGQLVYVSVWYASRRGMSQPQHLKVVFAT